MRDTERVPLDVLEEIVQLKRGLHDLRATALKRIHDVALAIPAVTGDAKVDNGDVTLTTSFLDGADLSFTMPTGWTTAIIVASGSAFVNLISGGSGSVPEVRVEIGSDNGVAANAATAADHSLMCSHQAVVTGDVTVALAVRQTVTDNFLSTTHEVSYIAIKAS